MISKRLSKPIGLVSLEFSLLMQLVYFVSQFAVSDEKHWVMNVKYDSNNRIALIQQSKITM